LLFMWVHCEGAETPTVDCRQAAKNSSGQQSAVFSSTLVSAMDGSTLIWVADISISGRVAFPNQIRP
jgi:hypothetical protein